MVLFNGEKGALAASVITFYMGGIPLIYGSQEVGVEENVPFFSNDPINWSLHPEMLQAYKDMMGFRNGSDALKKGDLVSYPNMDVVAFKRIHEAREVLVFVNTRDRVLTYAIPAEFENTSWLDVIADEDIILAGTVELEAYQYRIFSK
jgi:glycosidase